MYIYIYKYIQTWNNQENICALKGFSLYVSAWGESDNIENNIIVTNIYTHDHVHIYVYIYICGNPGAVHEIAETQNP